MDAAANGVAEEQDDEQGIDQQDIFDRMVLFLAAVTRGLFSRVLGADNAPFRPVMGKRGGVGAEGGRAPPPAGTRGLGLRDSRALGRAVRERAGASPRARSAASNAGSRTWIH